MFILSISYHIVILHHIISYLYHILTIKRALSNYVKENITHNLLTLCGDDKQKHPFDVITKVKNNQHVTQIGVYGKFSTGTITSKLEIRSNLDSLL
jgi:hypothetical protein